MTSLHSEMARLLPSGLVQTLSLLCMVLCAMPLKGDEMQPGVKIVPAFVDTQWEGWQAVSESGEQTPLRPIVLTHAGDGSGRFFVADQRGMIHVLANSADAKEAKLFLDIRDRVTYKDSENEEGLLGLAFPLDYETKGEFYVYYSTKSEPHVSIISRFKVNKDNPNKADAASEERLMRIPQPFWNHNGGNMAVGPDGHLYIALGDGGRRDDPFKNAQNTRVLLGKILRLDINNKAKGLNYGIPSDNPFADGKDGAQPEIYAYGFRNPWGITFDRKTGEFWVADVGQDLWEEIDIVVKGGNYGWNLREAKHKFMEHGSEARPDLIEPIFEYDHNVGKSITGGFVYRGKNMPALDGKYLYADYVSGKVWALAYNKSGATTNLQIQPPAASPTLAVIAFGEDEAGEMFLSTPSAGGVGIYRLAPAQE